MGKGKKAKLELEKRNVIIVIAIIFAVGLFYFFTLREGHNWGGDFAMYIHHAKNIAEGLNYRETGYIFNPLNPIAPKTFPPVFPLLLSPIYLIFGLNLAVMKVEVVLFFLASVFLMFQIFKDDLPFKYIIPLIILISLHPFFWSFRNNVISDFPFLFFVYLSIFLIHRKRPKDKSKKFQFLNAVLTGFAVYLACGTRSIGIVLIPTLILSEISRYRKITKFSVISTLTTILFLLLQTIFFYSARGNLEFFFLSKKVVLFNISMYSKIAFLFWNNGYIQPLSLGLLILMCILAAASYITRTRKKITALEIFPFFYSIPIIVWPYFDGPRFIFPLIPLFLFYAFTGLYRIILNRKKKIEKIAFITVFSLCFLTYFLQYTKMDFGKIHEGIAKKESVELFNYIKKSSEKDDVFIFVKPRVLSFYTERKTAIYPIVKNDTEFWKYLLQIKASYLIVNKNFPNDLRILLPFVLKFKSYLSNVFSNDDFILLKIQWNLLPYNK